MGTAPSRALYAALEMAAMTEGGACLIISLTIFRSRAMARYLMIRLVTFNLSTLRLSFEIELPIRKNLMSPDRELALYIVRELLSR